MFKPTLHVRGYSDFGWFKIGPALHFRDQPSALDLGLPLRAREAVPFPAPGTCCWITHVEHDRPMSGRALAYVALIGVSPSTVYRIYPYQIYSYRIYPLDVVLPMF